MLVLLRLSRRQIHRLTWLVGRLRPVDQRHPTAPIQLQLDMLAASWQVGEPLVDLQEGVGIEQQPWLAQERDGAGVGGLDVAGARGEGARGVHR